MTMRLASTEATMPASSATTTILESRATRSSMPVPTNGRLGLEEGHALALHVRAHERAVGVVMLEEGDHPGGDRDHLLRGDVHVVDLGGADLEEFAVLSDGDLADEVALVVDLGVGLGDDLGLLLVGGQVVDLVRGAAVLDGAVRRLDEAELVHAGVGRKRVDQADVRAFGRLDRADAPVVRRDGRRGPRSPRARG